MMGLSGTFVDQRTGMLPLEDIAVGLSRIPRFGGQTVIRWSVVEHLLAGMAWVRNYWNSIATARHNPWYTQHAYFELAFGLHDAHEAMTSDVPSTFKTWSLRRLQKRLDKRLCAAVGGFPTRWLWCGGVKALDRDMLLAEASIVCPRKTYERIVDEQGGREATHAHRAAVGEVLGTVEASERAGDAWLKRVNELLEEVR